MKARLTKLVVILCYTFTEVGCVNLVWGGGRCSSVQLESRDEMGYSYGEIVNVIKSKRYYHK